MKKVKNIESKQTEAPAQKVKEGKIKKNKNKKVKKPKDAITKLAAQELAPKVEQISEPNKNVDGSVKIKKKNKKNKNKVAQQQKIPETNNGQNSKSPQKVANNENQAANKKKQKKSKKEKLTENIIPKQTEQHKELTEVDLKKIEKKKAKKLAQKLKKQQKLAHKKEIANNKDDSTKTNGFKKDKPADKVIGLTSTKVLTKKEKKAKKRQLIKEQKLAEKQTRDPAVEAATVFVGNLPVNTKRVQLINLFQDYAPVNSIRLRSAGGKVLHKHKQRKEAGALNAYVVLKDKQTAEKAVSLNGTEFKGHHLRVTLASINPQHNAKDEGKRTVFVGNLKYSATEEALREIFSTCGEIEYVRCLRDGDKGCKGVAYVCFKTPDAVGLALELNETILDERPIHVERYSVKKLGAKEARDAQAEKEKILKKGAKQRVEGKKSKKDKFPQKKISKNTEDDEDKKPKKSEFRGVKVDALKKKQKLKKKKSNNQMLELAKKIAPKSKAE